MVDYSKWDHLVISDDEEEATKYDNYGDDGDSGNDDDGEDEEIEEIPRTNASKPPAGSKAPAQSSSARPVVNLNKLPSSRPPGQPGGGGGSRLISKYVKLAPGDNGAGLPPYVYSDPKTYKPEVDPEHGLMVTGWGMPQSENGMETMMRKMGQQFNYGTISKSGLEYPEKQFFDIVRDDWLERQKGAKALRDSLLKKDFRFRITLVPFQKNAINIFRVFRCSGGMTLRALADKVLIPIMGWVRNYHSWCFIRSTDGAWACPTDSGSIDVMHLDLIGFSPLDDRDYKIADFFQANGDSATFIYDFGDRWLHLLKLEEILTTEEGSVLALDGAGACPPEDSNGFDGMGNRRYFEALAKKTFKYDEAATALNYKDRRNFRFDPKHFDLEETRARLRKEISSAASAVSGSKVFQVPLSHLTGQKKEPSFVNHAGKGEKVVVDSNSFLTETIRDGSVKDPKNTTLCVNCGNPNNLKLCSGCGIVRYCGRECQVADWKNHKEACKKKQAEREAKKSK